MNKRQQRERRGRFRPAPRLTSIQCDEARSGRISNEKHRMSKARQRSPYTVSHYPCVIKHSSSSPFCRGRQPAARNSCSTRATGVEGRCRLHWAGRRNTLQKSFSEVGRGCAAARRRRPLDRSEPPPVGGRGSNLRGLLCAALRRFAMPKDPRSPQRSLMCPRQPMPSQPRQPSRTAKSANSFTTRSSAGCERKRSFDIDRIDYDASLFELGVNSMGAATIAGELEQALDKTLNPEVLYELETINELADYVEGLPLAPARQVAAPAAVSRDLSTSDAPTEPLPDQCGPTGSLQHFERLNRRVRSLKEQGLYFFEPEISHHDGAWVVVEGKRMLMFGSYEYLGLLGHPQLKSAAFAAIERIRHGAPRRQAAGGHHDDPSEARSEIGRLHAGRRRGRVQQRLRHQPGHDFHTGRTRRLRDRRPVEPRQHRRRLPACPGRLPGVPAQRHGLLGSNNWRRPTGGGRWSSSTPCSAWTATSWTCPPVVDLCRKHGAMLMVDEAHSLGVLGKTGRGIQEHFGLQPDDIDVKMGTLSKTLAGCGGFVAGRETITTYLRHHARGYIFSGALPAGQASAAIAALEDPGESARTGRATAGERRAFLERARTRSGSTRARA